MLHSPLTEVVSTCEWDGMQCKLESGEISFLVVNIRTVRAAVLDESPPNEIVKRLVLMTCEGRRFVSARQPRCVMPSISDVSAVVPTEQLVCPGAGKLTALHSPADKTVVWAQNAQVTCGASAECREQR